MAETPSFYEWLIKQRTQRTPVGEYARAVARDSGFPRDVASLEALVEYVRTAKGSAQLLATAKIAYQAYLRNHRPAPNL